MEDVASCHKVILEELAHGDKSEGLHTSVQFGGTYVRTYGSGPFASPNPDSALTSRSLQQLLE